MIWLDPHRHHRPPERRQVDARQPAARRGTGDRERGQPGTTRDSILRAFRARWRTPSCLIDTAGVRRRSKVEDVVERASVAKTLQAIDEAHVVILVLDAHDSIAEQDASVLGLALERGRALIIAVNKWDGIAPGAARANPAPARL
jgi:predicted GTPase